jgi:hypothetical protein
MYKKILNKKLVLHVLFKNIVYIVPEWLKTIFLL